MYVSPSTTMSRPAIASAAEAMRPDARCEIVEQMRQLLETAQALLIALTELAPADTPTHGCGTVTAGVVRRR